MSMTATYSPEDDGLRLYSSTRLDDQTYERLRYEGFTGDPKRQFFIAHTWSPKRADLLTELCGEIGNEDKSVVKLTETAIRAEKDLRANRIREIETKRQEKQRHKSEAERLLKAWSKEGLTEADMARIVYHDRGNFLDSTATKAGTSLWDASHGFIFPKPTVEQVAAKAIQNHRETIAWADRWLEHYSRRLSYERDMLITAHDIPAGMKAPEVGGACQCWASPHGGWSFIQKVNEATVTVQEVWGNSEEVFSYNVPFDQITAVMSRDEVEAARRAGLIVELPAESFYLASNRERTQAEAPSEAVQPVQKPPKVSEAPAIPSGIQTPRGPITRSPVPPSQSPQELFKRQLGQPQKRGMGM